MKSSLYLTERIIDRVSNERHLRALFSSNVKKLKERTKAFGSSSKEIGQKGINMEDINSQEFTKKMIRVIIRKAIRRGLYFRKLSRIERGILELTAKYVPKITSLELGNAIARILAKLVIVLRSKFLASVETLGRQMLTNVLHVAKIWKVMDASSWDNKKFVTYWGITLIGSSWRR